MATQTKKDPKLNIRNKANEKLTKKHKIYSNGTAPSGSVYIDYTGNIYVQGKSKVESKKIRNIIQNGGLKALKTHYPSKTAEKYWSQYLTEKKKYNAYKVEYKIVMKRIDEGKEPFEDKPLKKEEKKEEKKNKKDETQNNSSTSPTNSSTSSSTSNSNNANTNSNTNSGTTSGTSSSTPTNVNSPEAQTEAPTNNKKKGNRFTEQWKANTAKQKADKKREYEEKLDDLKDEYYSKYDKHNLSDGDVVYDPRIPGFVWKGKSTEVQALLNENFNKLTKEEFVEKYKKAGFFAGSESLCRDLYDRLTASKKDAVNVEKKYKKALRNLELEYEGSEYSDVNKGVHSVTDQIAENPDQWGELASNLSGLAGRASDAVTGFLGGSNSAAISGVVGAIPSAIMLGKNIFEGIRSAIEEKRNKKRAEEARLLEQARGNTTLEEQGYSPEEIEILEKDSEPSPELKRKNARDKKKTKKEIENYFKNRNSKDGKFMMSDEDFDRELLNEKLAEIQAPSEYENDEDDEFDEGYGIINPGLDTERMQEIVTNTLMDQGYDEDEPEEDQEIRKPYGLFGMKRAVSDKNSAFDMNNIMDFANYLQDVRTAKEDEKYLSNKNRANSEISRYNEKYDRDTQGDSGLLNLSSYATRDSENARQLDISKDFVNKKREALDKFRNLSKENKNKFLERYESFVGSQEGLEELKEVVTNNIFDPARNEKLSIIEKAIEDRNRREGSNNEQKFKNAIEKTKLLGYVANKEDAELLGTEVGAKDQKSAALKEKLAFEKYLEDNKYELATEKQKQQMVRDYLKDSLAKEKLNADMSKFEKTAADKYDLGKEGINAKRYAAELGLQGKQDMGRLRKEGQMYSADVGKERALDVANIASRRALDVTKMKTASAEKINADRIKNSLTIAQLKDLTNRYGIDFKFKGLMNSLASKEMLGKLKLQVDERMKDKELSSLEKRQLQDLANQLNIANINALSAKEVANIQGTSAANVANIQGTSAANVANIQGNTATNVANIQQQTTLATSPLYQLLNILRKTGAESKLLNYMEKIVDFLPGGGK